MVMIVRTTWSGGTGGEGLTQFALDGALAGSDAAMAAVRAFWDSVKAAIPSDISLQVEPTVENYDASTGTLIGEYTTSTVPAVVVGTNTFNYASPLGVRLDWLTGTIRNGRRVRGRTYLVPVGAGNFGDDGQVMDSTVTFMQDAGVGLMNDLDLAGTPLQVWSRPSDKWPLGAIAPVNGVRCPKKPAILSGRRD